MTPTAASVDAARRRARRLAWIALIAAILSLLLVAGSALFGIRPHWTSWGLSLLLIGNSAVFLVPWSRQHPQLATVYYRLAVIASIVICTGVFIRIWHH